MSGKNRPSLEELLECGRLQAEILHPGGLGITRELAELCHFKPRMRVLEVASGTGESACFLAETLQCEVIGVDVSEAMIERARIKARARNLRVEFRHGDAHFLPFDDGSFDGAISECTTCCLEKPRALGEMVRVTRTGGHVGIHDLCWKDDASNQLKQRLAELEDERPETLDGWRRLFEQAGLRDVVTVDKSDLIVSWITDVKRQLGITGQFRAISTAVWRWGLSGLLRIMKSERIFCDGHLGYGLIVGDKP